MKTNLTPTQRGGVILARDMAVSARRELSLNAANGSAARPTVAQLNKTLDRLQSIVDTLEKVVLA